MIASLASLVPARGRAHVSTAYADWVAAHDPAAATVARDLIADMGAELNRSWTKPGAFVDAMAARARRLPPAHLPWFWDTVGHRLIGYGSRPGGRAYVAARAAEAQHGLPVDPAYRRANGLLFATGGAMPAKEFGAHQRFLADTLEPVEAHTALDAFLRAWAGSKADLPADLVRRVRASAKAAGHGEEEVARVVGAIVSVTRKKSVPDVLLTAAEPVLAAHPPTDEIAAGLLDVFPESVTDGGPWLRMLIACGATEALEAGRVVPEGGLHQWIGTFVHMYQYARQSGGGVGRQQLPPEFLDLVGRLGPRLRAAGEPVTVHTTRHYYQGFDADVLDACLAAGATVVDPGPEVRMRFWGERSRRDLAALAADPVFGPRLEGTVHADLRNDRFGTRVRKPGSAVTLLPGNEGIAHEVAGRVGKLVDTVGGGGMAGAEEAVSELETVLDRPTVTALDGIAEALANADAAGALRRSLAAGLPEELGWPALESVYAEFAEAAAEAETAGAEPAAGAADDVRAAGRARVGAAGLPGVVGVTSTWPVLTVFGPDRAVAVAPDGVRASCGFTVPEAATMYAVHYAGGSFLVSWSLKENPYYCDTAVWADRPDEPFTPDETGGLVPYGGKLDGAYGFQFETADGGGRHGGLRALGPGGTGGIDRYELQVGDGSRIWTNGVYEKSPWRAVDAVSGEPRDDVEPPDLPGDDRALTPFPEGMALAPGALHLAPLPAGLTDSPLGSRDGLVGTRLLFRTRHRDPAPDHYLLESIDGRSARFDIDRQGQRPWGLWAPPESTEPGAGASERGSEHTKELMDPDDSVTDAPDQTDHAPDTVVLAEAETPTGVRAYTADGVLLWELDGHHSPAHPRVRPARRVTVSGGVALPPAFWYLLRTRDTAGSRALRTVRRGTADVLLAAAHEGAEALRAAVARELPQITAPVLVDAVVAVADRAARVEERRRALHRRVTLLAEAPPALPRGTAPDTELLPALFGLVASGERDTWRRTPDTALPATLSALAADGACLAGTIGEEVRRLSPPAAPHDWSQLLGSIDAVAWRAAVAPTPDPDRAALLALLATWADQPFARSGSGWWVGRTSGSEALDRLRESGTPVASAAVWDGGAVNWFVAPAARQQDGGPVPTACAGARLVRVERDDTARLRALITAIEANGPLPLPESAAVRFAELTGVRLSLARLVLAGLVGRDDREEDRSLARKAPYKATPLTAETYEELRGRLGCAGRRAVLAAAVPEDPAELWRPGGVEAAVARMAGAWNDRIGALPAVHDEAADALETSLGLGEVWARRLADGYEAARDATVPAADWDLAAPSYGLGVEVRALPPKGVEAPYGTRVGLSLGEIASALVWAWTDRPVGDPAAAGATDLYERLRAELARPELLLELPHVRVRDTSERIAERFGPARLPVSMDRRKDEGERPSMTAYDSGTLVVCAPGGTAFLRPARCADPEVWRRVREVADLGEELDRVALLLEGGALDRMMRRSRSGAVPDGAYEADPRSSCPDLVAHAAVELGVGTDAAALYLQIATLAAPTDRNVRRWNGWTTKQHAEVRAELLTTGAVREAKRPRAGRTVFLPGEWTELKAPYPPLEKIKLTSHQVRPLWGNQIEAPFVRILPTAPLHEMFAEAWKRGGEGRN
ncbi:MULTISPECIES: hypothetical protein [unclassified Streptomyces]|uniref:hypothetical protein n=1 Tax=unclassified Streptomyces TaxID=2593676 RepID=UPI0006FF3F9F|nr:MULTISPECIES: hypothetical protein [unclassified Streptomyces]KQX54711.1 hypothetical protein ASD33_32375 [Streptomyces sp. Root1304]KRA93527.1 hypothetical protein ASE09_32160 [Streptomyces sp. Root66D1]